MTDETDNPGKRGPGRPKRPLDERLCEALGLWTLDFSDDGCWHGPKKMLVNGKNTSLLRAAFAVLLGRDELPRGWVIKRPNPPPCHDPECRNPRHWVLDQWRGYRTEAIPPEHLGIAQQTENPVHAAAEMLGMRDEDRRPTTPEQCQQEWPSLGYDTDTWAKALAIV